MRVALFSPLTPLKTGIADYTEEMLLPLARHFTIDLYIDEGYTPANKEILSRFKVATYNPQTFDPGSYDAVLYHMGNDYAGHRYIYEALKRHPGIVVMHDYVLHGFYAERSKDTGDFDEYRKLLVKYYQEEGNRIASAITDWMPYPIWESPQAFDFPLNEEILEYAQAVIVHSDFVREKIRKKTAKPIVRIPSHAYVLQDFNPGALRKKMGVGEDDFLLCSVGFVNKNKRYDVILSAMQELTIPNLKYVIAGKDRGKLLRNYLNKEAGNVIHLDYLPLREMDELISASDVCLNLRFPTMGESSASQVRMMGYGKPVLVTNFGSYAEFPDHAVLKVDPDIDEKELIKRYVTALAEDRDFRLSLGREAAAFVQKECSLEKCCEEYARFIRAQSAQKK